MASENFPVAYLGAALEGRYFPKSLGGKVRDIIYVRDVAKAFVSELFFRYAEFGVARTRNPVKRNSCASSLNTGGGTGEHPVNCVTAIYTLPQECANSYLPRCGL
jgi:hypothetical protein